MLFDILLLADWNKIGDYRQHQTDLNTKHENRACKDWDYKFGDKVLLQKAVFSANQKAGMNVIDGLSHQFIQMAQFGFNMDQSQSD